MNSFSASLGLVSATSQPRLARAAAEPPAGGAGLGAGLGAVEVGAGFGVGLGVGAALATGFGGGAAFAAGAGATSGTGTGTGTGCADKAGGSMTGVVVRRRVSGTGVRIQPIHATAR